MQLTPSQEQALDINHHICVTAGAGSGKTTVLVERYLKILQEGNVTPRQVVAITFTEKAATEMKERVIEKLSEIADTAQREHFLQQMNTAPISTIHAFCSRILREFAFAAKVPANFSLLQGIDQRLLLQETLQRTLRDIATNPQDRHHNELRRALQHYGNRQKLGELFATLVEKREIVAKLMREVYDTQNDDSIYELWNQHPVNKWVTCLEAVLQVAKGKDAARVNTLTQKLAMELNRIEQLNLLKEIADLITTTDGNIAKQNFFGRGTLTKDLESHLQTEINFLQTAAGEIKGAAGTGEDDELLLNTTRDLLALYTRIFDDYQIAKLATGHLDFADLQMKMRDLLRQNADIQQKLIDRHKYYMIDEFQDTNELQFELVMLLTNCLKDANLFIVGDPKQSIYGFRNADVRVFERMRRILIEQGGKAISLKENFRSLRDPIGFVNYFFGNLMGDGSETEFEVPYEQFTKARPVEATGTVEILCGRKGDETANEYALIARHIKNMIGTARQVWIRGEEDETPRHIQYGDIAILIRSRRHLPDIENALHEAGIPYLTTGGIGFYQRQEIYDIMNYLTFLDAQTKHKGRLVEIRNDTPDNISDSGNHDQESTPTAEMGTTSQVSLIGILRGPAFGISDTELYEISRQRPEKGGKSFWDKVQAYVGRGEHSETPRSMHLQNAVDTIERHMQVAQHIPINQLILAVVNETGMIGTLKTGKKGQQRWANYQKLLDIARNFDSDEKTQTLSDFIKFLDILITDEPREGDAPVEADSGAVQIMTIHAAKGKQFPIVILPCLGRGSRPTLPPFIDETLGIGFNPHKPTENYDKSEPYVVAVTKNRQRAKEAAESKRLFYVGATRARDKLILSGTLPENKRPQNMLKWLYTHLNIGEDDNVLKLAVELNVLADNRSSSHSIELPIPLHRALEDIASETEDADKGKCRSDLPIAIEAESAVEFPAAPKDVLQPTVIGTSLSVDELANYARCSLRYYLEHVLRLPPTVASDNGDDSDGIRSIPTTMLDFAVRHVLRQIKTSATMHRLDEAIHKVSHDYQIEIPAAYVGPIERSETGQSAADSHFHDILRTHTDSFLNSELGKTALAAAETYTERKIHVQIGKHILTGSLPRLFKDAAEQWQIIDYKTDPVTQNTFADNLKQHSALMELYGILLHKKYPEQKTVTVNLFFTEVQRTAFISFHLQEIADLLQHWQKRIADLQQEPFEKNLQHCRFCPYADEIRNCLIG